MNRLRAFPSLSSNRKNSPTRAALNWIRLRREFSRELEKFLIEAGARYVPENMQLNIRITNVDLAGDFELFRGPQAEQVRINKGLYPPRIALEFEVVDSAMKVIKTGKRDITDINYQ